MISRLLLSSFLWINVIVEGRLFTPSSRINVTEGMCHHIRPDKLPSECYCSDSGPPYSLVIFCNKTFASTYFNDTIGMKIDIDPCDIDGSKVSIDVTETKHNIDYPITGIRAGQSRYVVASLILY
jgi:hypothetical protein